MRKQRHHHSGLRDYTCTTRVSGPSPTFGIHGSSSPVESSDVNWADVVNHRISAAEMGERRWDRVLRAKEAAGKCVGKLHARCACRRRGTLGAETCVASHIFATSKRCPLHLLSRSRKGAAWHSPTWLSSDGCKLRRNSQRLRVSCRSCRANVRHAPLVDRRRTATGYFSGVSEAFAGGKNGVELIYPSVDGSSRLPARRHTLEGRYVLSGVMVRLRS